MQIVFGYGIVAALFIGGISAFGYVAAIVAGGDAAVAICDFIYKKLYPVLVYISTADVLLGLVKMYISGESAFKSTSKKSKK